MNKSRPSITGTTHTLPFDRLSPRDFERLCLWLVEREGFERAEHLGAAGSEQGRDLVAWREGEVWAFQCKRVQRFGPGDAEAEVDKILGLPEELRPAALVFLVACDVSDETRRRARARCGDEMACEFWALTELDGRVKRHPEIVEEFFQATKRNIIQRILGTGPDERRALRNRRAMLELVRNFWVEGVLEQSLHGAAMIELGMEEKPGAVEHPWDMVLQTEREDRTLPPGTRIIDVFDEMGGNLLILGEPGSGKTTMLLELARDTIARAEQDPTQPIPVVFNLSSWADERQPIAEWGVAELNTKYNIPKKVARPWVECDELLLLFDGLDEVALKCREDCAKAINEFRQDHLVPLVVCSRVAEYEALTARLRLQGAVLLQSLTPQQIDDYLGGAGVPLSAVRATLRHDPTLQELAQTPLMLSIMTLAYKGVSVEDLKALATVEARRRHLFDTYVKRMFERQGDGRSYSPEQTIHWLAWLAQKTSQHAQSVFLIERMQPSWLSTRTWRWVYALVSRLIGVLILGSGFGLIVGQIVGRSIETVYAQDIEMPFELSLEVIFGRSLEMTLGQSAGLLTRLISGLSFGLSFGLISGLSLGFIDAWRLERSGKSIAFKKSPTHLESAISFLVVGLSFWLTSGLSIGLSAGLILGLIGGLNMGPCFGLTYGLMTVLIGGVLGGLTFGLLGGLMGGLIFGLRGSRQSLINDVQAVEALIWSWRRALISGTLGLIVGLVFGLGVVLIETVIEVLVRLLLGLSIIGPIYRPIDMLISGLMFGPILGLIGAMFGGLSSGIVKTKVTPNQGIRLSARNAAFAALILGPVLGLVSGLSFGPGYGVGYGLISGLLAALWYGGLDIIQHHTLRLILCLQGHTPWNYARFLDYAAERIFLRKVGGGYIFIHRLLQDYFASLYQDQ